MIRRPRFEVAIMIKTETRTEEVLLVSSFEPFGGETTNASASAMAALPDAIGPYRIEKMTAPVIFGDGAARVAARADDIGARAILCLGQAAGRRALTPEAVAINLRYASIPDNAGRQPKDEAIDENGPAAYFSTMPARAMAEAIRASGVRGELSYSAGAYVCNDMMYSLLRRYADTGVRVGFIHVPASADMDAETAAKGIAAAIGAAFVR